MSNNFIRVADEEPCDRIIIELESRLRCIVQEWVMDEDEPKNDISKLEYKLMKEIEYTHDEAQMVPGVIELIGKIKEQLCSDAINYGLILLRQIGVNSIES